MRRGIATVLWLLGCSQSGQDAAKESYEMATPVPVMHSAEVRELVDYLVPTSPRSPDAPSGLWSRCLAGEDVRHLFKPRFALVEIGPDAIRLAGSDVVKLYSFVARDTDLRGQMLTPLYEAAASLVSDSTDAGFSGGCWPRFAGEVLIATHPDTPFSVLREVMYTLGQAQFSDFSFVVSDPGAVRAANDNPPGPRSPPKPDGRCRDTILATLRPDRSLLLHGRPYHGGALRTDVANLKTRLISTQGEPDIAGMEAWVSTVTHPRQEGGVRSVDWTTVISGPVRAGEIMALTDVVRTVLPEATWTVTSTGGALTARQTGWASASVPALTAQSFVAVVPSNLPAIYPTTDCLGADGKKYPHPMAASRRKAVGTLGQDRGDIFKSRGAKKKARRKATRR